MTQGDPSVTGNERSANTAASADPNRNVRTINPYPNATSSAERRTTAADTSPSAQPSDTGPSTAADTSPDLPPDAQPSDNAPPTDGTERGDDPNAATFDTTPMPKATNGDTPASDSPPPDEKSKKEKSKEEKAKEFISDVGLEDGYVNVVVVFKRNHERATYRMTYDEARRLANDFVASQKPTDADASTLAGVYEARYVNRTPCFLAVRLSDVLYIG